MPKKTNGLPLRFERREKKNARFNLDSDVIEMIDHYPEFHAKQSGEQAPSREEVVEQIVRKTLGSHSAFKQFLQERRSAERETSASKK